MKTLQDLFLDSLADIYYAEEQLVKALAKMVKAATHDDLREAFQAHLLETEGHAEKVAAVFAAFGVEPRTKKCPAIQGLIKEAEELISENKKSATSDAALIFAAQKVEHYEIASYGGLREWARLLGNDEAASLLDEILKQEKGADTKLNRLAKEHCNSAAQKNDAGQEGKRSGHPHAEAY